MINRSNLPHWPDIVRPLSTASMALGRLGYALELTPLHQAWLWRELTRLAPKIAQSAGYLANQQQVRMALIGAPIDHEDHTAGLAAAKRIFLAAAPLFREIKQTDSHNDLWPAFWDEGAGKEETQPDVDHAPIAGGEGDRIRLKTLVTDLASFADDGRRPALINLLVGLRTHALSRQLSPQLVRIALPLALLKARLIPKAAPGLLGGQRLPLGMSRASGEPLPPTDWLSRALTDLGKEAEQSHRRLAELGRQHRAWHAALAAEGLRRHARAPLALDLLIATPVVSLGLIARHLGCSHVAAGQITARLVGLGILIAATSRSRHKIFIAGDLALRDRGRLETDEAPLSFSEPVPLIDVDTLGATLDGLLADLDRQTALAKARLAEEEA